MSLALGKYYPKEKITEIDSLMRQMCIPLREESKSEIETKVGDVIVIPTPRQEEKNPEELKYSNQIQTHLKDTLGIDLAGYFDVDVDLREKDSVVRVFCKASAFGIGAAKATADAINSALTGIVSPLRQLRTDLDKVLEKLSSGGA